ncbi:hypothetical protein AX14_006122 [Amanita brunnescens Koide BX004]|nr:hypothetical protein AX14_006122 [Amanita brunnescens Koide BX004]
MFTNTLVSTYDFNSFIDKDICGIFLALAALSQFPSFRCMTVFYSIPGSNSTAFADFSAFTTFFSLEGGLVGWLLFGVRSSLLALHFLCLLSSHQITLDRHQAYHRIVKALAIHSRNLFNYHCADLIKLYVNIAELQFAEVPTPARQLDQLGIDLLQCILAANVEEYYEAALMDIEKDTWGPNLKTRESDAKIIFLHEFKERFIVPDGHFALEIVSKAHATAVEITKLSKKVLQSVTTLTKEARWMNKLYTKGVRFDYSNTSLLCRINSLITEIDTCFKNDAMSEHIRHLRRITRNRCIHCASFSHKSVDHHLSLGIFHVPGDPAPYICSTPSKKNDVTSQGTPDVTVGTDSRSMHT